MTQMAHGAPSSVPLGLAQSRRLLTGAQAVAEAMRQIDPDVVPVYPITPQTPIVETFAQMAADGRVHSLLLTVESEHSAMSAAIGSALAGARTMTATASQGLAYMVEVLYVAAGLRAPIVVAVGNRALSAPINIHGDHSDAMLARDSGCLQMFAENAQEAYDLTLLAVRLAEHPQVLLPALVGQDGFTITHSAEPVDLLPDEAVAAWVGPYHVPAPLLDTEHPVTVGAFSMPDSYFRFKVDEVQAHRRALTVWEELAYAYAHLSGRELLPVEAYRMDGARRAFVVMGSAAGTVKEEVDALREEGEPVGLVKLRAFRPFPAAKLRELLSPVEEIAVLERAVSPGGSPPLWAELAAVLGRGASVQSFVFGLGGRDLIPQDVRTAYAFMTTPSRPEETRYLGLERGL
jgi:pyruvate ferredoxin oxidoreductase alpha subunit